MAWTYKGDPPWASQEDRGSKVSEALKIIEWLEKKDRKKSLKKAEEDKKKEGEGIWIPKPKPWSFSIWQVTTYVMMLSFPVCLTYIWLIKAFANAIVGALQVK